MRTRLSIGLAFTLIILFYPSVAQSHEIHNEVREGHLDRVREIIESRPVYLSCPCGMYFGKQPLHIAARYNRMKIFDYLVSKGADIKAKDDLGNTVLHMAAEDGNTELMKLLIAEGADPLKKNKNSATLLHFAATSGNLDAVKLCLKYKIDVNDRETGGNSPLHNAARFQRDLAVRFLVEKGADIGVKGNSGFTPLHESASLGSFKTLKYLVLKGADLNVVNDYGYTPLESTSNGKKIAFLIQNGAMIRKNDMLGALFSEAAESGNLRVMQKLLNTGANVNSKGLESNTALHRAAALGDISLVKFLIEHKAEPNLYNRFNKSPLDISKNFKVFSLIYNYGGKLNSFENLDKFIDWSISEGDLEIYKYLLICKTKSLPNRYSSFDLLAATVQGGKPAFTEYLISKGANLKTRDSRGNTLLHVAALCINDEPFKFLLSKGMDINSVNNEKNTPLHEAAYYGVPKRVKLIAELGGDINAKNNKGMTALNVMRFDEDMYFYLIEKGGVPDWDDLFREVKSKRWKFLYKLILRSPSVRYKILIPLSGLFILLLLLYKLLNHRRQKVRTAG